MTCKEKLTLERPHNLAPSEKGGCWGCPSWYGYLPNPDYCECRSTDLCYDCWDREIPETEEKGESV